MNVQSGPPANHKSIFWISVLALFTAAMANAIRGGASEAMKAELFDPTVAARSGEYIGTALGNAFLGFAISLLIISPLLDKIGAKRILLFAAACFIFGPALILFAPSAGSFDTVNMVLNMGMILTGFGWGATEGSINALTTTIYPEDKTGRLNVLHAWWPFGIIIGGLLSVLLLGQGLDWRVLIAVLMIPGVILGIWTMRHEFPQTESTAAGVTFKEMMVEPFKHIGFWIFPAIMFLTASAELAPGAWVQVALDRNRRDARHLAARLCLGDHVCHAAFCRRAWTSLFGYGFAVHQHDSGSTWPLSARDGEFARARADRGNALGLWRLLHVANDAGGSCAALSAHGFMGHWPRQLCWGAGHLSGAA